MAVERAGKKAGCLVERKDFHWAAPRVVWLAGDSAALRVVHWVASSARWWAAWKADGTVGETAVCLAAQKGFRLVVQMADSWVGDSAEWKAARWVASSVRWWAVLSAAGKVGWTAARLAVKKGVR